MIRLGGKILAVLLVIGFAAACSTPYGHYIWTGPFTVDGDIKDAKAQKAPDGSFNEHLRAKYLMLSELEYAESDWADAAYFAQKAGQAGRGEEVLPGMVEGANFRVPAEFVPELGQARAALMAKLDSTARTKWPDHASTAQTMFDCWVQEQEENHQFDEIAACRKAFDDAMAAMVEQPAPAEIIEPAARDFMVFFDFDRFNIRDDAASILGQVMNAVKSLGSREITLVGHADRAGASAYNQRLSERRANEVKAWFGKQGVAAGDIKAEGRGEDDPRVPTPDGVREQENRRVEIRLD